MLISTALLEESHSNVKEVWSKFNFSWFLLRNIYYQQLGFSIVRNYSIPTLTNCRHSFLIATCKAMLFLIISSSNNNNNNSNSFINEKPLKKPKEIQLTENLRENNDHINSVLCS